MKSFMKNCCKFPVCFHRHSTCIYSPMCTCMGASSCFHAKPRHCKGIRFFFWGASQNSLKKKFFWEETDRNPLSGAPCAVRVSGGVSVVPAPCEPPRRKANPPIWNRRRRRICVDPSAVGETLSMIGGVGIPPIAKEEKS